VSDSTTEPSPINTPNLARPTVDVAGGLRWALYLGMSWTWVIGMFLPVLLIRDFGPWAWFAFAIPNVLGAAAMGWAIKTREQGIHLVANHRAAARAFSLVTIAFHVFFLLWLVPQLVGSLTAAIAFGVALVVMANVLTTTLREAMLAGIPLIVSLVIAMIAAGRGSLGWPQVPTFAAPMDVLGLSAVCVLGFLTCPYLDLTFHRARQAAKTSGESQLAFGVGFGVVFCSMIVFTLLYAGAFVNGLDRLLAALLGVHICVQAIYTVGIHAAAMRDSSQTRRNSVALWLSIAGAVVVALVARGLESRGMTLGRIGVGEVAYRTFLSFYGLVAPAYVWLCVYPGRGFVRPHSRELRMTAIACVIAAPFYWIAFVYGPMGWVLPGVAIIVVARFALDFGRRDFLAEQRAAMLTPTDPR
jgi:hypothetical protein